MNETLNMICGPRKLMLRRELHTSRHSEFCKKRRKHKRIIRIPANDSCLFGLIKVLNELNTSMHYRRLIDLAACHVKLSFYVGL